MNQYYLISQLPSLDAVSESAPLPISEERFYELCRRFLGKKAVKSLSELTLIPDRNGQKADYAIIDRWNEGERQLRLTLGAARAKRLGKEFDSGNSTPSTQLIQAVRAAAETKDPLEAEKLLNRYRLDFLEELRPADYFCEEALFYYALRLKLLSRLKQFDAEMGGKAYKNIYDSIIHTSKQEAEQ